MHCQGRGLPRAGTGQIRGKQMTARWPPAPHQVSDRGRDWVRCVLYCSGLPGNHTVSAPDKPLLGRVTPLLQFPHLQQMGPVTPASPGQRLG